MSTPRSRSVLSMLIPRVTLLVLLDILVINLSAFLALFIRYEFDFAALSASTFLSSLTYFAIANTAITILLFLFFRLYNSLWGFAGADELVHIFAAAALSAAIQALLILPGFVTLPRSFPAR